MQLPALYHWSPADRHDTIRENGLVPGSPNHVATAPQPHICLCPTPSSAWGLSGGVDLVDCDAWDLWQVRLAPADEVHIPDMWGNQLREVNVRNQIPADRLWWIARRTC